MNKKEHKGHVIFRAAPFLVTYILATAAVAALVTKGIYQTATFGFWLWALLLLWPILASGLGYGVCEILDGSKALSKGEDLNDKK